MVPRYGYRPDGLQPTHHTVPAGGKLTSAREDGTVSLPHVEQHVMFPGVGRAVAFSHLSASHYPIGVFRAHVNGVQVPGVPTESIGLSHDLRGRLHATVSVGQMHLYHPAAAVGSLYTTQQMLDVLEQGQSPGEALFEVARRLYGRSGDPSGFDRFTTLIDDRLSQWFSSEPELAKAMQVYRDASRDVQRATADNTALTIDPNSRRLSWSTSSAHGVLWLLRPTAGGYEAHETLVSATIGAEGASTRQFYERRRLTPPTSPLLHERRAHYWGHRNWANLYLYAQFPGMFSLADDYDDSDEDALVSSCLATSSVSVPSGSDKRDVWNLMPGDVAILGGEGIHRLFDAEQLNTLLVGASTVVEVGRRIRDEAMRRTRLALPPSHDRVLQGLRNSDLHRQQLSDGRYLDVMSGLVYADLHATESIGNYSPKTGHLSAIIFEFQPQ